MKPQITIDLPPHLHDFLYHEFGTERSEEAVAVTAANDLGKLIQSMITVADRPPKQAIKEHPVTLALPIQEWNHFIFKENFIYIPEWKQRMLREYIEASYRIRIREYFVAGYEKGYNQYREEVRLPQPAAHGERGRQGYPIIIVPLTLFNLLIFKQKQSKSSFYLLNFKQR